MELRIAVAAETHGGPPPLAIASPGRGCGRYPRKIETPHFTVGPPPSCSEPIQVLDGIKTWALVPPAPHCCRFPRRRRPHTARIERPGSAADQMLRTRSAERDWPAADTRPLRPVPRVPYTGTRNQHAMLSRTMECGVVATARSTLINPDCRKSSESRRSPSSAASAPSSATCQVDSRRSPGWEARPRSRTIFATAADTLGPPPWECPRGRRVQPLSFAISDEDQSTSR